MMERWLGEKVRWINNEWVREPTREFANRYEADAALRRGEVDSTWPKPETMEGTA